MTREHDGEDIAELRAQAYAVNVVDALVKRQDEVKDGADVLDGVLEQIVRLRPQWVVVSCCLDHLSWCVDATQR